MSTMTRWSYAPFRRPRRGTALHPTKTTPRAFTLIELLVVVAIIALLISILLPSLSAAREQAKTTVCGKNLQNFGTGFGVYSNDNEEWIPGLNTSGAATRGCMFNPAGLDGRDIPVQSYDWMSPITYSGGTERPATRAKRFKELLTRYRCPTLRYNSMLYNAGTFPDKSAFDKEGTWPALSYLMPIHFQFVGQNQKNNYLADMTPPMSGRTNSMIAAPTGWEVQVDDYLPKVERVGMPARKIAAADGTRYLDATLTLDFDATPDFGQTSVSLFGSFTSAGAWWAGDTSYGIQSGSANWDGSNVGVGSPSAGHNLGISYRHNTVVGADPTAAQTNKGAMEALFFDGHVQRLSDRQSREPHLWYPSGAKITKPGEGLTTVLPAEGDTYFVVP